MFNVTRAPPRVSLRCLEVDLWRISERRINAVQMPVCVTKVALEHLALVAARNTTLRAQDGLVVAIEYLGVVWPLVAVATVLRSIVVLVSNHATGRVTLTAEIS